MHWQQMKEVKKMMLYRVFQLNIYGPVRKKKNKTQEETTAYATHWRGLFVFY